MIQASCFAQERNSLPVLGFKVKVREAVNRLPVHRVVKLQKNTMYCAAQIT